MRVFVLFYYVCLWQTVSEKRSKSVLLILKSLSHFEERCVLLVGVAVCFGGEREHPDGCAGEVVYLAELLSELLW
jgi:hypothetical protein